MSIIYDALKKVKGEDENRDVQHPGKSKKSIFLGFFIILMLLIIFGVNQYIKKVVFPQMKVEETSVSQLIGGKPEEAKPARWQDVYTLEGIIYDEKEPLAIINGEILKINDRIDGVEVRDVSVDSAEIYNPKEDKSAVLELKEIEFYGYTGYTVPEEEEK